MNDEERKAYLERLAAWFERDGWRGMTWTREAIAKQLRAFQVKEIP